MSKALHKLPTPIQDFAFSPTDESRLLIAGGQDDETSDLEIVEIATGKVLGQASYASSFPVDRALFSNDSSRIFAYGTGHASIWDSHLKQLVDADVESSTARTMLSGEGHLLLTIAGRKPPNRRHHGNAQRHRPSSHPSSEVHKFRGTQSGWPAPGRRKRLRPESDPGGAASDRVAANDGSRHGVGSQFQRQWAMARRRVGAVVACGFAAALGAASTDRIFARR